jgi:hypothetical protein
MDMRRVQLIVLSLVALAFAGGVGSAAAAFHLDRGYGKDGLAFLPGQKGRPAGHAGYPVITADGGVIFERGGREHCTRQAGAPGYVRLTASGTIAAIGDPKAAPNSKPAPR